MELEVTNDYLIEVIMILWDSFSILIKGVCGRWSSPNILGLANEEKSSVETLSSPCFSTSVV